MGNSVATAPAHTDYYLHDLPDIFSKDVLGGGRFLKTIQCVHDEGLLVVKVYLKREKGTSLTEYVDKLVQIRSQFTLYRQPNVCPFARFVETDKAGYLIRQFFYSNLDTRISTRPFLAPIEKKWITYQLMLAVQQAHDCQIYHGDIKTNNVMVTTYNWVFLADFASFKPTFLPVDHPADFSFFFDASGDRSCNLAPERFYEPKQATGFLSRSGALKPSMDVFALACTIAELYLDGTPLFEFSDLLAYRKNQYDPSIKLKRIQDDGIRHMIKDMIVRDPLKRKSVQHFLHSHRSNFPAVFKQYLHSFIAQLMMMSPNDRIATVERDLAATLKAFGCSCGGRVGAPALSSGTSTPSLMSSPAFSGGSISADGSRSSALDMRPVGDTAAMLKETESLIKKLEQERDRAAKRGGAVSAADATPRTGPVVGPHVVREFVGTTNSTLLSDDAGAGAGAANPTSPAGGRILASSGSKIFGSGSKLFGAGSGAGAGAHGSGRGRRGLDDSPDVVSVVQGSSSPSSPQSKSMPAPKAQKAKHKRNPSVILLVDVVTSSMRNVTSDALKVTAMELLTTLSLHLSEDEVMHRVVPYFVTMLSDPSTLVRARSVGLTARLLDSLSVFPDDDGNVFPDYFLPALSQFPQDPEPIVRDAFASNVALLAEIADRQLSQHHAMEQKRTTSRHRPASSRQSSSSSLGGVSSSSGGGGGAGDSKHGKSSGDAPVALVTEPPVPKIDLASKQAGERQGMLDAFASVVTELLTRQPSVVRRTLIHDLSRLAFFFGRERTSSHLLPMLLPIMDDPDWELRHTLLHNIVGISVFIGPASVDAFVLPLVQAALHDREEFVVAQALNAQAAMIELRLFRKHVVFDLCERAAPLLTHPNLWIRYGAVSVFAAAGNTLSLADIGAFVLPPLKPFLKREIIDISEVSVLNAVKQPLSRIVYDRAIAYFSRNQGGMHNVGGASGVLRTASSKRKGKSKSPSRSTTVTSGGDVKVSAANSKPSIPAEIFESGLTREDEDRLRWMNEYIVVTAALVASRAKAWADEAGKAGASSSKAGAASLSASVASDSAAKSAAAADTMDAYLHLEKIAPVHGLSSHQNEFVMTSLVKAGGGGSTRGSVRSGTGGLPSPSLGSRGSAGSARQATVRALTSKRFISSIPVPPDLGTLRRPNASGNGVTSAPLTGESLKGWRPRGVLVAHLHEHTGAVNSIATSDDNLFFVTGGDDGKVKVWDVTQMEKSVTNHSQLTYSSQKGRITSVAVCQNTHTIASGSSEGSIHLYRVDYGLRANGMVNRYTGVSTIRNLDWSEGAIVGLQHYANDTSSALVAATQRGRIHGFDLRMQRPAFAFDNPLNLGFVESFAIDPSRSWMVLGTSRGYFSCWDLRFRVLVKSWGHPSKSRIHKVLTYPASKDKHRSWILASAGDNQVWVWDAETNECHELYRVLSPDDTTSANLPSMTARRPPSSHDYAYDELSSVVAPGRRSNPVRALLVPSDSSYLLTAGSDRAIRYWDLSNVGNSYLVSGNDTARVRKPRYSSLVADNVTVYQEHAADSALLGANIVDRRGPVRPPLAHADAILDMKAVELPHRMLLSAGRDGVVKVWK